jgi:phosphoglucomutase
MWQDEVPGIYAESFIDEVHLEAITREAQEIVNNALGRRGQTMGQS